MRGACLHGDICKDQALSSLPASTTSGVLTHVVDGLLLRFFTSPVDFLKYWGGAVFMLCPSLDGLEQPSLNHIEKLSVLPGRKEP